MSDSCLSIHISAFISQHLYISGSSARSMSLESQHLCISGSSAKSMSSDSYLSIHMYLRILCKIHISEFIFQHPYISQEPLEDPCFLIHISASICISGPSAKSMFPIHILISLTSDFVPCAGKTQILTSGDAFCVAVSRENSPVEIRGSVSRRCNANFDLRRRVLCGPTQRK